MLLDAPRRLYRRVESCFGPERIYPSPVDGVKALLLRLAAAGAGRRLLAPARPAIYRMRLRGLDGPVYVRRSTSDFFVLRDIFEDDEYGDVRRFDLPPRPTVVDLGGNVGYSALYWRMLWPGARVAVVEPDAGNFAMLARNCRAGIDAGKVVAVRAFAAAVDGAAEIDRSDLQWGFKKRDGEAAAGAETVPCVGMPTLLARAGFDGEVDLLKCDIEGTERELFAGCGPWIGRVRHLAVETHPPYAPEDLYAALRAAGWNFDVVEERRYAQSPRLYLRRKGA